MNLLRDLNEFKSSRETPQGRLFDAKMIKFDCNLLIFGALGLAISFTPFIYVGAAGHILTSFINAPIKFLWALLKIATLAIESIILAVGIYLV